MNVVVKFAGVAALGLGLATGALAQETTLKISSWLPPTHGVNTEIFAGIIDMMEKATDGQVTGELVFGLAPPPAQTDLVMDGAADMAIIFHGYQPGRYVGTKLIELPGYEGSAEAASAAYWQVHEEFLADLDEHRGVKLIALNTHGPGQIHSVEPVESLDDLKGLKIRIGGGVAGDVGAELGMVGINVPAPKVYETLESGAADAVAMNVGERIGFKLDEVAKNLYEMPGGFYRGSFAIIMSQEKFDSLPEDVQAKLDADVFGLPASTMAGAAWDLSDKLAYDALKAADDNQLVVASDADQEAFKAISADIIEKVMGELEAKGVDAEAAHARVQELMSAN